MQLGPVDLNAVVCEVLTLVHSDLIQRRVTVDTTGLAPDLPGVLADQVQMQQVLLNLILNACDAVPPDALDRQVTIATAAGVDGTVEHLTAHLRVHEVETVLHGAGNGPVDAFVAAVRSGMSLPIHVLNYHEHGVGAGEDATAVAYVQLRVAAEHTVYGVGLDPNIVTATLKAVLSAVNRAVGQGLLRLPQAQRAAVA